MRILTKNHLRCFLVLLKQIRIRKNKNKGRQLLYLFSKNLNSSIPGLIAVGSRSGGKLRCGFPNRHLYRKEHWAVLRATRATCVLDCIVILHFCSPSGAKLKKRCGSNISLSEAKVSYFNGRVYIFVHFNAALSSKFVCAKRLGW